MKPYFSESGIEIYLGDCVQIMRSLPPASMDLSVFSPPFGSLYAYSDKPEDMGNSHGSDAEDEFMLHFQFFCDAFAPLMKPGRNACVHVAQPSRFKSYHGHMGIWDLRGRVIDSFIKTGMIYYGDITIGKNPQAQAIRTKSHALMFASLEKDSAMVRPALADYLLVFKAPGENLVPVKPDCSREEWIEWASPLWANIRETNVLNVAAARSEKDERHLCPLQLDVIARCVRLWSNEGERVFSPFAGIGSEGYESVLAKRFYTGVEINPRYADTAISNLQAAVMKRDAQTELFA